MIDGKVDRSFAVQVARFYPQSKVIDGGFCE